jgi:hypothetical protein
MQPARKTKSTEARQPNSTRTISTQLETRVTMKYRLSFPIAVMLIAIALFIAPAPAQQ